MSAFSRGYLLRYQNGFAPRMIHLFLPSKSFQTPRNFSISPFLNAVKKNRPPQTIKKVVLNNKPTLAPRKPISQATPAAPTYQSYATTLAQKLHPTLLYTAPSHTFFTIACYTGATFCFSYAGIFFWTNTVTAGGDLAIWVVPALGGVSFLMAGLGTYLVLGPARLIKTITAIPKHSKALSTVVPKSAAPELQVEVELRKMFPLPFFPARKLYVKPEEIILPEYLAPPPPRALTATELRAMQIEEDAERQKLLEYEQTHIMSKPFRHIGRGFFNMYKAIGRTWHREGFMSIEVKGGKYKLDVMGGWALDGGKALDRLCRVKGGL